jgi:predicted MPP superfamily phosphohydrolase
MNRLFVLLIVTFVFVLLDLYVYFAIKHLLSDTSPLVRRFIQGFYVTYSVFCIGALLYFSTGGFEKINIIARNFIISAVFINLIFKLLMTIFLLLEDIVRGFAFVWEKLFDDKKVLDENPAAIEQTGLMSRSTFFTKTAIAISSTPVVALTFGIISGAYDYRVKRVKVALPHLPKAFHGLRIAQISDIHSGSFYNKKAVNGGVEMLLAEKPDVVFFTGDLVNNSADEAKDYVPIFKQIKAPLGVYSTLGNHDYGDYVAWPSLEAKRKNLADLKLAHKELGWRLMMNEHKFLEEQGEKIAILGIENFGAKGHFPKYGKMNLAYPGTEQAAVKLLLSHDPSHWDYEVRPKYPDVDIMFSGHTHGMQFGVDTKFLKWSPVQYMYKQWADLYRQGNQYLYVNRGYGFIGYPGRVGILPEITVMELVRG